jgi:hypothetical protein
MNDLRAVFSIIIFIVSTYCIFDLFLFGFSWAVLAFIVIGYICAYYLWPKKRDDEAVWYDSFELIVEFPFRSFAFALRGIGRMFKNIDSGVDF